MNFKKHFKKYPELVASEVAMMIRELSPNDATPVNRENQIILADKLRLPHDLRHNFYQLSRLIPMMVQRIDWAIAIKENNLKEETVVELKDGSIEIIKSICNDYSIRIKGRRVPYSPLSLKTIKLSS